MQPYRLQHARLICPPLFPRVFSFTSIESVMPSNYVVLCCSLLLLLSIFHNIRGFSNESALRIRWPNSWSFNTSYSNEYSGLISFKIDWFDLLAVQGTLKSLLQHNNSKALILQYSALFMANSHIHIWLVLIIQTFVSKVMSAKLLNVLSRLVIAFLSRSKRLLILWLQSPSIVILEPKKIKSATVSTKIIGWDKNQNSRISWVSNFLSFQETAILSKERTLAPPCPHELPQSRLLF